MEEDNYWEEESNSDEFEEVEAYESTVEEEVEVDDDTVRLRVTYSKLDYKGEVYSVGEVLELSQEEADELLGALSGRQYRHLEIA